MVSLLPKIAVRHFCDHFARSHWNRTELHCKSFSASPWPKHTSSRLSCNLLTRTMDMSGQTCRYCYRRLFETTSPGRTAVVSSYGMNAREQELDWSSGREPCRVQVKFGRNKCCARRSSPGVQRAKRSLGRLHLVFPRCLMTHVDKYQNHNFRVTNMSLQSSQWSLCERVTSEVDFVLGE